MTCDLSLWHRPATRDNKGDPFAFVCYGFGFALSLNTVHACCHSCMIGVNQLSVDENSWNKAVTPLDLLVKAPSPPTNVDVSPQLPLLFCPVACIAKLDFLLS